MPREVFVAGQVLTAAELNVVSDQSVMVFAGTAARGSAIPSPTEGMVTYLSDSDEVQVYDGSVFKAVGPGKILQVVTATNETQFTTTSSSFQATGLTATITPSSTSSKVFVSASNHIEHNSTAAVVVATLFRGTTAGTNLGNGANGMAQLYNGSSTATRAPCALSVLDSPSTTSAQAYNFAILSTAAGNAVNAQMSNSRATITLMEVAG